MKKKDFGFVVPLESEASIVLNNLKKRRKISYGLREVYTGTIDGNSISLIISGCGKIKSASATQLLIDKHPANLYIHYGSAGAISSSLKIGDVVAATEIIEHDVVELFPKKVPPPLHRIDNEVLRKLHKNRDGLILGSIISGDEDVIATKRRDLLFKLHNSLCVDWESAGFVLTCNLNNVSGLILRIISDYAYEHTKLEYEKNKVAVMSKFEQKLFVFLKTVSR